MADADDQHTSTAAIQHASRIVVSPIGILAILVAILAFLVLPPLVGWPRVVRVSAVLFSGLVLLVLALRPWRWSRTELSRLSRWEPSTRAITLGACVSAAFLFWIVLTRFQHGDINAVDFTIYFDRPLFQTSRGHVFLVETTDDARFSHLTHVAVHAYWALIPIAAFYWIHATPYWLLGLAVFSVVAGGVHVLRIMRLLGAGGPLASATALAYVLNDNTARTLNYGFHAEVLYAWFVPWLLDAGLRRSRGTYLAAAMACVLVKEDAVFPVLAVAVALALVRGRPMAMLDRLIFLGVPTVLALANLAIYYRFVVPALAPGGEVMYAYFWASHGRTPIEAVGSIVLRPWRLARAAATSGFFTIVLPPHLFLPAVGWRWTLGVLPLVLVYASSDNDQVRAFGIYYSIPIVPFLVIGASMGALLLARRILRPPFVEIAAASVVLLGALLVGLGYSLRPWMPEIARVERAVDRLSSERRILVQSGLYPHAGYDPRVQLLTPDALRDETNAGAAILIAPRVSAYPFRQVERACIARLPEIWSTPEGLHALRLPPGRVGAVIEGNCR